MPAPGYPLSRDPVTGRILPSGATAGAGGRVSWEKPLGVEWPRAKQAQLTQEWRTKGSKSNAVLIWKTANLQKEKQTRGIIDWARDQLDAPELPPEPSEGTERGMMMLTGASIEASRFEMFQLYREAP